MSERLTPAQRRVLERLEAGDRIVYSEDGDCGWFCGGDRAFVEDKAVIDLRDQGFLKRECGDEENYRGKSEYDTISEAGRAALTSPQG